MTFLPSPANIRQCLADALDIARRLDAAVAFVGRDWSDIIGTFSSPIRLVCWLSSTNTNPYAVEQMMLRGIKVRQLSSMHAKVYIFQGASPCCIVGSANLSESALSEEDASGQYEAAVKILDRETVGKIARWFGNVWKEAKPISADDLSAAKTAWEKLHSRRRSSKTTSRGRTTSKTAASYFPADWVVSDQLADLADQVRDEDFAEFREKYQGVLRRVATRGRSEDIEELIKLVAEWTGHIGKFYPALKEPRERIRQAFTTLFNRGRPIEDRLADLAPGGSCKLNGFGLTSLTMILSWRFPTECPPFNRRTQRFLTDFGLDVVLPKALSPKQYGKWIAFAQELSARLRLPSAGHIDRLVWEYTRDLEI
jgi:hypothetical protein